MRSSVTNKSLNFTQWSLLEAKTGHSRDQCSWKYTSFRDIYGPHEEIAQQEADTRVCKMSSDEVRHAD